MGNGPLKQTRRTPPAGKSHLGLVGHWVGWVRVGGGAAQDCTELGVELGEPLVLALQLLHPLLVCDLPLLVVVPQLRVLVLELPHPMLVRDLPLLELDLSAIELDLSQLVVDNGSPVERRQQAAEPGQRGVILRLAD